MVLQEDYPRLRPLSYPLTDVFLVCFDINRRQSFTNIKDYWIPELDHHIPEAPRVLVGCKGGELVITLEVLVLYLKSHLEMTLHCNH